MSPQSKSRSSSRSKKDITFFDLLKQDHQKVKGMFEQIEEDEEVESREAIFGELQSELQDHMQLEERLIYPVLEKDESTRDKILESYEEHNVAKTVLNDCSGLSVDDERWQAKVKVLQELVNHHVQEEEKNMFKMARKALGADQIRQITEQIMQQKSAIEKKAA